MNEHYDDLLASGRSLQGALFANRVRRSLRAKVLGIPLSPEDRETIQQARTMMNRALVMVETPAQPDKVASLVEEAQTFRTIRDAWATKGGTVERSALTEMRDTLTALLEDKVIPEPQIEVVLGLFGRMATLNLGAFHAADSAAVLREETVD